MAKIVLQNQASPVTPDCGFTAMYINCNTCLPTFKLDDGSEAVFVTSQSLCNLMDSTIYDSHGCKTDVFDYINCAIGQVSSLKLCPVDTLPQVGDTGVIYMVPNGCGGCNARDEYLYVDGQYELIGSTQIDTSDLAKCCDIPTDNSQLANGCGYTTCTGDMNKCMYDPDNKATNVYNMDNMDDGISKVAMTTTERTKLSNISGVNTGDETTSSIKCKLGISTLSGCNTGDETNSTIKCKLGTANCADDGYLKACDFASFINKQNQLVSGENIITINGCTILRCGDICIENLGGDMKACMYDPYGCCTDMFNRANHYGCMSYACVTGLGSAATRDVGTNCGNVVVVQNNGKISSDILPAQDLVDVCVFDSEAAMLAWCDANRGDMAIRTDIARTYVMSGSCPSCIDSWTILPVPTSSVTSVNGCIGDVCLDTDDIDDSNSTKKYVSASEKACWCGKADPYVSGCTIKTINGCSILGCGNICIPNTITCVNGKTGNVCLTADDISDTGTGHLFVSQCEKNTWNCKINCEDAIVDNCQLCNGCNYIAESDLACLTGDVCNSYSSEGFTNVAGLSTGCLFASECSGFGWHSFTMRPGVLSYQCCFDGCYRNWEYTFDKGCTGIAQICDIPTDNCQLCNGCNYVNTDYLNCNYWCKHNWNVCRQDGFIISTGGGCGAEPTGSGLSTGISPGGISFLCVDAENNSSDITTYFNYGIQHTNSNSSLRSSCCICYTFDKCPTGIAQMCDIGQGGGIGWGYNTMCDCFVEVNSSDNDERDYSVISSKGFIQTGHQLSNCDDCFCGQYVSIICNGLIYKCNNGEENCVVCYYACPNNVSSIARLKDTLVAVNVSSGCNLCTAGPLMSTYLCIGIPACNLRVRCAGDMYYFKDVYLDSCTGLKYISFFGPYFTATYGNSATRGYRRLYRYYFDNNTNEFCSFCCSYVSWLSTCYIDTCTNYACPYMACYDGSPVTKKYLETHSVTTDQDTVTGGIVLASPTCSGYIYMDTCSGVTDNGPEITFDDCNTCTTTVYTPERIWYHGADETSFHFNKCCDEAIAQMCDLCGGVKSGEVICICYTCKACVPSSGTNGVLYITCD